MTNPTTDDLNPSFRTKVVAGFIFILLLAIAVLNLPSPIVTPSKPYVTIVTAPYAYVRSGPNVLWNPPLGTLMVNQQSDMLGRSPDGEWFKIKYFGNLVWIAAADAKPSIDLAQIPVEDVPRAPTLTSSPPTAMPFVTAPPPDLVLGNVRFSQPLPLSCGKAVAISVEIINLGSEATPSTGIITISDRYTKNQEESASTTGKFDTLQSGQTITVSGILLTITKFAGEEHTLFVTINLDGNIPDTNRNDNTREFTYTLQGDC